MRLGTLSWILAVARGIDLATGATVGRLSDKTTSRWLANPHPHLPLTLAT